MLRSLVGSEMCIRDSLVGGEAEDQHVLHAHVVADLDVGAVERADGQRACLLYTSDAADDLLCVDLGGRRLIKKKKKKV